MSGQPRSCDLTPCDFFLWLYIKNSIFSAPVVGMDDLRQRITNKFEEIGRWKILLTPLKEELGYACMKVVVT
jgi:hypothetical protein